MSSHLYIHIPFCRSKCLYCDFYSLPRVHTDWQAYLHALGEEAKRRRDELPEAPDTIYTGGGTPSLMPAGTAVELLREMKDIFGESALRETTIEVNPDDVTEEYAARLIEGGYNRFSMGVQSFSDSCLRLMGRRHDARKALEAARILSTSGNLSLDLIFGLPGQSMDQWERDVAMALELRPEHISCYSLMLEEGTALTRLVDAGRLRLPEEELSAAMYSHLCGALGAAGYEHYEISNFSLPGKRSAHNSGYWSGAPYLGLGPGAHSYDGKRRRTANPHDAEGYMNCVYTPEIETLSDEQLREEHIMLRLRTRGGLDIADYGKRFGATCRTALERAAAPLLKEGCLTMLKGKLSIPESHWLTSDRIIVELL